MFGAILKVTNSSFRKGMTYCRSVFLKKVIKLLAFIFEQSSYSVLYAKFILPRIVQYSQHHFEASLLALTKLKFILSSSRYGTS